MWPPAPWRNSRSQPLPAWTTSIRLGGDLSVSMRVIPSEARDLGAKTRPLAKARGDGHGPSFGGDPRRHRLVHGMAPEAVIVVLPVGPQVAQMRDHLLGKQLGRMAHLIVGHVADMQQAEDVADPERLDQLLHLLAHRLGRAGDDVAALGQVLPAHTGIVAARARRELR